MEVRNCYKKMVQNSIFKSADDLITTMGKNKNSNDMRDKIKEICNKLNREQLSVHSATEELLILFSVGKRHLVESILDEMNGRHPEYYKEVVEDFLGDGC